MIWLDWYCRMHSDTFVPPDERMGDPRRDLAMSTWIYFATYFRENPDLSAPRPLDFHWYSMLKPFIVPFLLPEATRPGAKKPPEPLGLVLTRQTAALLSDAKPPSDDASWMAALGDRSVYIDVPHGAVRVGDTLQLRAIFLRKLLSSSGDQLMLIAVVTDRGSEQARGRMFAVLDGNGHPVPALDDRRIPLTELGILPPLYRSGSRTRRASTHGGLSQAHAGLSFLRPKRDTRADCGHRQQPPASRQTKTG